MRISEDRDPSSAIQLADVKSHLIVEYEMCRLINAAAKKTGSINSMYAVIDILAIFFPEEFSNNRVQATKRVIYKLNVRYSEDPPVHIMCKLWYETGMSPAEIARRLGIARNTVYYHIRKEVYYPAYCALNYGEFNLLLDFKDLWERMYRGNF